MVDAVHDQSRGAWRSFIKAILAAATALYVAGFAFLAVIDPYNSGRVTPFDLRGIPDMLPHFGNASRARDQRFDAAIFGNSHMQALKPSRLDDLTGLRFVSLMMPGTFAADQLDTLEWYLAAHPHPRAIVIGTDVYWCRDWSARNEIYPRWLYVTSPFAYLSGLAKYKNFGEAGKRLAHLRSGKGVLRPDGYWDYSVFYEGRRQRGDEGSRTYLTEIRPFPINERRTYPDLDRLAELLPRIPGETAVILLRPPTYRTAFPASDTAEGRSFLACRDRIEALASSRPRTAVVDMTKPSPATEDPENFYDWVHYRDRMAVLVEKAIADALRIMPRAAGGS